MNISIKRVYQPTDPTDGKRILVDRLWPRGISKQKAQLDEWIKSVALSPLLRIWFGHKAEKFLEFTELYRVELVTDPEKQSAVKFLLQIASAEHLTLLYDAKSETINHATVLRDYLLEGTKMPQEQ